MNWVYCRDEIEDTLKPRVESLQATFQATYGDPSQYKEAAVQCYSKTDDLRNALYEIRTLYNQIGEYTAIAASILNGIPNLNFNFEFDYAVQSHKAYVEGLGQQVEISLAVLQIEVMVAAFTLAATVTVTTTAIAFAALGAVVAIFLAVADIIKSAEEEKKIRDTLRENKRDLLKAEADINKATAGMHTLQKNLCKDIMVALSKVSLEGNSLTSQFANFKTTLEAAGVFVTQSSQCDHFNKYSKFTPTFVKTTLPDAITVLITHVRNEKPRIQELLAKAQALAAFAQTLEDEVLVRASSPSAIFTFVEQNKPELLNTLFSNEFELIVYLATKPLATRACYWGISLAPFRSGVATVSNYQTSSVVAPCASAEVSVQTTQLASDLAAKLPPCRMVIGSYSTLVRDISGLMRYIANGPMAGERCYWGYDLAAIRAGQMSDAELNEPRVEYFDVFLLGTEPVSEANLPNIKSYACMSFKLCNNDAWLHFLLCLANSQWASVLGSACNGVPDSNTCPFSSTESCPVAQGADSAVAIVEPPETGGPRILPSPEVFPLPQPLPFPQFSPQIFIPSFGRKKRKA